MIIEFGDGGTEEDLLLRMREWTIQFELNTGEMFDGVIERVGGGLVGYWPWDEEAGEPDRVELKSFDLENLKRIFVY